MKWARITPNVRVAADPEAAAEEEEGPGPHRLGDRRALGRFLRGRRDPRGRGGAVGQEPALARVVADQRDGEREDEHEQPRAEDEERAAPADEGHEAHRGRQHDQLPRRHARAVDAEHEAAMFLEPARGGGGGYRRRGGARSDGGDEADGDEEMPELGHGGARHGADADEGHAAGEHPARAPAIGEAPHEGAGQPVERDGDGHGSAQRRPRPAEFGLERLDEDADGGAHASAREEHEAGRAEHDPRVVQAIGAVRWGHRGLAPARDPDAS